MIKRWLTLAAAAVVLTGCYHQAPNTSPTPTPVGEAMTETEVSIEVKDFAFSPATITVKPGAKISVTNQDSVGHTLTSDDGKSFDTKLVAQGQSATITAPTTPGSYPFHCTPHPYMKGILVVKE